MDGSFPTSLKYIISNVEYYGPALYLLGKNMCNCLVSVAIKQLATAVRQLQTDRVK